MINRIKESIIEIQNFLGLNDWDFVISMVDDDSFVAQVEKADYKRFAAHIEFSNKYEQFNDDDFLLKTVMHELCHIFTIMNLRQFSEDEYIRNTLGANIQSGYVVSMDILNEQMTVKLERLLTKYFQQTTEYKKLKSRLKILSKKDLH